MSAIQPQMSAPREGDDELLIGIDAGTSVLKAVAFDRRGRQIAVASTPNKVLYGADGAAEQDMNATWVNCAATLRALAAQVPRLAQRTLALAMTGQGDGTWLVDAKGEPVGPAMLWLDGRAAAQVRELRSGPHAQALAAKTGTAVNPSMQSPQLHWLRTHQPERLAHAATAMHCKDWLYFKATGLRGTSICEGNISFGNWRQRGYDNEVLAMLGLTDLQRLLPPLIDGSRQHAPLCPQAASDCGLLAGTPVVLAPLDVALTLMGGGAIAYQGDQMRRVGCSILGSTGMHGWVTDSAAAITPSAEAGYTMCLPLPGSWARMMSHMAATLNLDWLLALLEQAIRLSGVNPPSRQELLLRLNDMVLSATPAQAVFHPYIADNGERGPFVDADARAQLSGFSAGLGLAGTARALMEGICLATRDCYTALGPIPDEIRLSGGAARSPALRQVLANVLGRPVRVSNRAECGAAGAAIVAAVSVGAVPSLRAALPDWVDDLLDAHTTQPDAQQTALYDELFSLYRDLTQRCRPAWSRLAQLRAHHKNLC